MPELPEVETIKRQLLKKIIGKKIVGLDILLPKLVWFGPKKGDSKSFLKNILGSKIKRVERRAKILILTLSNDFAILAHLKLTGQLIYQQQDGKVKSGGHIFPKKGTVVPNKWTHLVFEFEDKSKLFYNDLRQFGWFKLVPSSQLLRQKELKDLGVEPLDKGFSLKFFWEKLSKYPKRKIKQFLMDQKIIAGLGNIYSDECLFCAGILPTRMAGKINNKEAKKLYFCVKNALKKAILKGGSSVDTYVTLEGRPGGFVPFLKIYGKEGKKCKRCGNLIKRIKIAGRSSCFCPECQR